MSLIEQKIYLYTRLGVVADKLEKIEKAAKCLRHAFETVSQNAKSVPQGTVLSTIGTYADFCSRRNMLDEAIAAISMQIEQAEAGQFDPNWVLQLRVQLARLHGRANRNDEMVRILKEAEEIVRAKNDHYTPTMHNFYVNYVEALYQAGDLVAAEELLDRCVEMIEKEARAQANTTNLASVA